MGFCRNILPGNAGGNPFPGYKLKTGVLCSLPAISGTDNGGVSKRLDIPENCIPVCVKIEGKYEVSSGKGETPSYTLSVSDNNGKQYHSATRNGGSGHLGNGSKTIVLNPLGAYDGDLEGASTIVYIDIAAKNGQGNLITDYAFPKVAVTMWLEKTGQGGAKPVKPKEYKRLYLYKDGDQCSDVTGGWLFTKPDGTASGYGFSLNKDGCLYCGGQNTGTARFRTANTINTSDYDRLMIEFYHKSTADDANTQFGVTNAGTSIIKMALAQSFKNKICLMGSGGLVSDKIDLWLWTGGYSTTQLYIKRVWLETVGE